MVTEEERKKKEKKRITTIIIVVVVVYVVIVLLYFYLRRNRGYSAEEGKIGMSAWTSPVKKYKEIIFERDRRRMAEEHTRQANEQKRLWEDRSIKYKARAREKEAEYVPGEEEKRKKEVSRREFLDKERIKRLDPKYVPPELRAKREEYHKRVEAARVIEVERTHKFMDEAVARGKAWHGR